jgi:hypothetical protein
MRPHPPNDRDTASPVNVGMLKETTLNTVVKLREARRRRKGGRDDRGSA